MPPKRKYNAKARQVTKTEIIEPKEEVKIECVASTSKYDESNPFVLPTQKRKTIKMETSPEAKKMLTNKQRKNLTKIVDTKAKKSNRAKLLNDLEKIRIKPTESKQMARIAKVRTRGVKKRKVVVDTKSMKQKVIESLLPKPLKRIPKGKPPRVVLSRQVKLMAELDSDFFSSTSEESSETSELTESSNPTLSTDTTDFSITTESSYHSDCLKPILTVQPDKPKSNAKRLKDEFTALWNVHVKRILPGQKINSYIPVVHVAVDRKPSIQAARLKLPILGDEQVIMEAIKENAIVIVAGETGSGKTTQLPQFLYEAGYAQKKKIGITEPRRIAAVSMSKRVAKEMNLTSNEVSYLIRYEGNTTEETKIQFMTDGVLMKEIEMDFLLTDYSVIIIDEAHERSISTDLLLGSLSRIVPYRAEKRMPLKLVIMSATLRLSDFVQNTRLFPTPPPVLTVNSRQYPVKIQFSRVTKPDYIQEAFDLAQTIIEEKPDGGILIFVSGRLEVITLVKKFREKYPIAQTKSAKTPLTRRKKKALDKKQLADVNLGSYLLPGSLEEDDYDLVSTVDESSDEDIRVSSKTCKLWALPLYSLLSTEKQERVFQRPAKGTRLCVVATNIAETSLTIPNIRYVIDTGKVKVKHYDKITGVSRFTVNWTSKASAEQRTGRAGRSGPGQCFRLYSAAMFNDEFAEFTEPDIKCKPVDELCLLLKSMYIKDILNFPFPTPPSSEQVLMAENRLRIIEAVEKSVITPLGKSISYFPVGPRFGKMLCLSNQHGLLEYAILMVSALCVPEIFIIKKDFRYHTLKTQERLLGDPLMYMAAIIISDNDLTTNCKILGLRSEALQEIKKLRKQLTVAIKKVVPDNNLAIHPKLSIPNENQCLLLRQLILSGMGDQVAKKMEWEEFENEEERQKYKAPYRVMEIDGPVELCSSSCLRKELPAFVVYQELYEVNGKTFMRTATAVEAEWLPKFVQRLCITSEPLSTPQPFYCKELDQIMALVTCTYGRKHWELPLMSVRLPEENDYFKIMAKYFVKGEIFEKMQRFTKYLLSAPDVTTMSWAQSLPRVMRLVQVFEEYKLTSKASIQQQWVRDDQFLLVQYLHWIPQSAFEAVMAMWPPCDDL